MITREWFKDDISGLCQETFLKYSSRSQHRINIKGGKRAGTTLAYITEMICQHPCGREWECMGKAERRADVALVWSGAVRKLLASSSYGGEICDIRADDDKVEDDRSKVQYIQQGSNVIQVLLLMHVSTSTFR